MALLVQKFGGTSVGTPERIRLVAQRIARTYFEGNQVVVVVSAMGDTTDNLIELAHQVTKSPSHREMDMLLTVGERISMALLSMALADLDIPALSLTGSQSGIITDENHSRARILRILGDRVRNALDLKKVVIVAGFQGVSEMKEITTLGRGGSDTSAVALAAVLKAEKCEIYTDVDGIYSADPRIVPDAIFHKTVSHDLMVEMATRGAGVLHPRSVELAKQYRVPLVVRNSLNDSPGTAIVDVKENLKEFVSKENVMEEFGITGTTVDKTKCLLTVQLSRSSVLDALWSQAEKAHLPIIAPVFSEGEVRFFSDRDGEMEWKRSLEKLVLDGFVKKFQIDSDTVPLSIVGDRFAQDGRALNQVFDTLSRSHIPVSLGSASSLVITVGIPLKLADEGVRALHFEFLKGKK